MRQVLGPGALGKPRGNGWRGRWEGGLGWGTHVHPWLFISMYDKIHHKLKKKKDKKKKFLIIFPSLASPLDIFKYVQLFSILVLKPYQIYTQMNSLTLICLFSYLFSSVGLNSLFCSCHESSPCP